jgi:hypothetical protein
MEIFYSVQEGSRQVIHSNSVVLHVGLSYFVPLLVCLCLSYVQCRSLHWYDLVFIEDNSNNLRNWPRIYYGCATRIRHKLIAGAGELYAKLLSQKRQSTYLHNRETKLGINDSTASVSVPLSISMSLLSLSIISYAHKHTTRGWLELGLCMWNRKCLAVAECACASTLSNPPPPPINFWRLLVAHP